MTQNAPAYSTLPRRLTRVLRVTVRLTWLCVAWSFLSLTLIFTNGCEHKNSLEQVLRRGELIVATRNGPTSYYIGPDSQPQGFEYDLTRLFAEHLGVRLVIRELDSLDRLLFAVARGHVDLAAAGLTVTPARSERVAFGPTYQQVREQVVYRAGEARPKDPTDLAEGRLRVLAGSSHEDRLRRLAEEYPQLTWDTLSGASIEPLFEQIASGEIDYAVADSTMVAMHRRYYPEIRPAFTLGEPQSLAWAFPEHADELREVAADFIAALEGDGRLAALREQHYGHIRDFDFVGVHTFLNHVDKRLPTLRPLFEEASERSGLDWRLLAAIGYQESHWNSNAVSPTGVRGVMMLTQQTAEQLGIDNRLDPRNSVLGGARYFKRLRARLPQRIKEPDRTWLALAAYNIGMGHLEDARIITEIRGGNPDKWLDVKENLPLLTDKRWYSRVRYGYARGHEPVKYVENIRSYYDILVWLVDREAPVLQASADEVIQTSG